MISEQRVISEGRELINQRIFKLDSFYQLNITFAIDGCSRAVLSSVENRSMYVRMIWAGRYSKTLTYIQHTL